MRQLDGVLEFMLALCMLSEAVAAHLPVLLLLASVLDWPAALEVLQLAVMTLAGNPN